MFQNNNGAIIKKVSQKYYRANKTRNIVLACAIILTTVMITSACSTFYSYMKLSKNQELKEIGTTANAVLAHPTQEQIDLLSSMNILQSDMSKSYEVGQLINNPGQAGVRIDMYSVTNWDKFNQSLVENMQGTYPAGKNEIMMSTWLLSRLGINTPQLGMKIPLSVAINSMDHRIGETHSITFTLSGFYDDTAYISTENSRIAYVSDAFLVENPQEVRSIGFFFKNTSHYRDKIEQVKDSVGLKDGQEIRPAFDGKLNMRTNDILLAVFLILFFMFDGYLIIYNVAYISVTRDVRFYGLLKTLGTTYRQIKSIVYRNVFRTALFALPVGILLGWGLSFYIVPIALASMKQTSSIDAQVNSVVLLIAALLSALTLFISYRAPAQKAGRISPIEASKFTEQKMRKKYAKGGRSAKLPYMALRNILRSQKRVFIVVLTLFLGTSTLLTLMTILKSFNVDEYINSQIKYDIALYNSMTRANFSPTEEQHFTPELLARISGVDGISNIEKTTVIPIYQHYSDEVHGEWLRIKNEFLKSVGQEPDDKQSYMENPESYFWGQLIGIDDKKVEEYNRTAEIPIDVEAFSKGEVALVTDLNGSGIATGTKIPLTVIATNKNFDVTIGGQIHLERDAMNGGAAPWLVVSNHVIKNYAPDAVVYSVKINADKGKEQNVLNDIVSLTESDHSISRISKIEQSKAYNGLMRSFSYLAAVITIVLSTIGILNFVNTMLVSIVSRKQELAVLASIGATKKQIKGLITYEGCWYALIALALTFTIGSGLNYLVFNVVKENMEFGTFTYPLFPMLLYTGFVFLLCGTIPRLLYRLISRESTVERLRQAE